VTEHEVLFAFLICFALVAVSSTVLPSLTGRGWASVEATLFHMAGIVTGCTGAITFVFESVPGSLCWIAACAGYAVWMSLGYGWWVIQARHG
jgi:hypothetical protein